NALLQHPNSPNPECGLILAAAALAPDLRPVVQAFAYLALEAALGRIVKGVAPHLLGKIVLAGKRFRLVVVVEVAGGVVLILHQLGRRIEDVFWRQQRAVFLRGPRRSLESRVDGIRFWRGCEIQGGLRKGE